MKDGRIRPLSVILNTKYIQIGTSVLEEDNLGVK
jgi:hypothetical protein